MGKDTRVHNVYIREEKWKLLLKAKKRTGKSVSWLLTHGFGYWLKNNPKDLEDLAEEFESTMVIREAKQSERESGDFLGSFEKEQRKIAWIKETIKDPKLRDALIKRTEDNYARSRNGAEKMLKKEAKKKTESGKGKKGKEWYKEKFRMAEKIEKVHDYSKKEIVRVKKKWKLSDEQVKYVLDYAKDEEISFEEACEKIVGRGD